MDEDTPLEALPRNLAFAPTSALEQPSLAASYVRCLELYQNFLRLLGTSNCRIVHLEHINVGTVLEEYGRFRIWGEQTRAALPEGARGSLDDTIRDNESLKGAVHSILGQLSRYLSMAIPIAEKEYNNSDQDSESSMSADSDVNSEDSDQDRDRNGHIPDFRRSRVSKIFVLVNHIFEQIRLLYHVSVLLNRPGLSGRYLRSTGKNDDFKLSHFAEYDYRHIVEKLQQWKGDLKVIVDEEEAITTIEDIRERKKLEPPAFALNEREMLCRRLAIANTRRREQLQYWIRHPDRPDVIRSQNTASTLDHKFKLSEVKPTSESIAGKSQGSTIKLTNQDTKTYSHNPKSMTSKQSFSTVAISDVFDTQTKTGPRTIYAQSIVENKTTNRVPDVPKAAKASPTFKCPYCNLILESRFMLDRLSWKRHVFRDLRPYICTFPDCLSPQKQYVTRRDWIYHELQMHRRQWICSRDCQQKFATKDLMMEHLRNSHSSSLIQHQLPLIIEVSERPIDEDEIIACPLCPSELYLRKLQIHLAEHLEAISLFVLPSEIDQIENADSDKVAATRFEPDQDKMGSQAALSSLGFSEAHDNHQTEEDFAKLIVMEETKVAEKLGILGAIGVLDESTNTEIERRGSLFLRLSEEQSLDPALPSLSFEPIELKNLERETVIQLGRSSNLQEVNVEFIAPSNIGLRTKTVSRSHAEISFDQSNRCFIKDLGSSAGTFLNEIRLSLAKEQSRLFELKHGDILQLGLSFKNNPDPITQCVRIRIHLEEDSHSRTNNTTTYLEAGDDTTIRTINTVIGHASVDSLLIDELDEYFSLGRKYSEADIHRISLLLKSQNLAYSRIPRIYIVLRLINSLKDIDLFLKSGVSDISFPFSTSSLPTSLHLQTVHDFLGAQTVVLTKAIELEKDIDENHIVFEPREPLPFDVKAVLGKGLHGAIVEKVTSLLSHETYARKCIRRHKNFSDELRSLVYFRNELAVLKRLSHIHCIKFIGSYTCSSHFGLLMSPVCECDLKTYLESPFSGPEKLLLLRTSFGCLASALTYLHHDRGILHGNIEPENILINRFSILLAGFGTSYDYDWSKFDSPTIRTRTLLYTSLYAAPEIPVIGMPHNYSYDIWSLGCVFLEILTFLKGHLVSDLREFFKSKSNDARFFKNIASALEWIRKLEAESERDNVPWISYMLSHNPDSRPTAAYVLDEIIQRSYYNQSRERQEVFCGSCCMLDDI